MNEVVVPLTELESLDLMGPSGSVGLRLHLSCGKSTPGLSDISMARDIPAKSSGCEVQSSDVSEDVSHEVVAGDPGAEPIGEKTSPTATMVSPKPTETESPFVVTKEALHTTLQGEVMEGDAGVGVERIDEESELALPDPPVTPTAVSSYTMVANSTALEDGTSAPADMASIASSTTAKSGREGEERSTGLQGAESVGGALAPVIVNKVVDLRDVKKTMDPLLFPPASTTASKAESSDGSETPPSGSGSVKVDLSAGKRMIEFQLNVNAAEDRREVARLKLERARAESAIAEETSRALASVNARLEAQRGGRGVSSGIQGGGGAREKGSGVGASATAESQIRAIAERHGIRVRFMDNEYQAAVEQIRSLARAHGIWLEVDGEEIVPGDATDGGGDVTENKGEAETGAEARVALASSPPGLPSPRPPSGPSRSPSPATRSMAKTPNRKMSGGATSTVVPGSGGSASKECGQYSGSARMIRMALQARGSGVSSGKDAGPATPKGETGSPPSPVLHEGSGDEELRSSKPAASAQVGARVGSAGSGTGVKRASNIEGKDLEGGVPAAVRSAEVGGDGKSKAGRTLTPKVTPASAPKRKATSNVERGGAPATCNDPPFTAAAKIKEEYAGESGSRGAIDGVMAPATATGAISGRKREATRSGVGGNVAGDSKRVKQSASTAGSSSRVAEVKEVDGSGGAITRGKRVAGKAPNAPGFVATGSLSSSNDEKERTVALARGGRGSKRGRVTTSDSVTFQSAAESVAPPSRSTRRASPGGAAWNAGNNLFKGAMAGILARDKRPSS